MEVKSKRGERERIRSIQAHVVEGTLRNVELVASEVRRGCGYTNDVVPGRG